MRSTVAPSISCEKVNLDKEAVDGPISMRVTTDLGELSEFGELAGRTRTAPKHASPSGPRRLPRAVEFREAGIHDADGP